MLCILWETVMTIGLRLRMGGHAATIIKRVLMTPGRERRGED
jgi:hypothetical protein